MLIVDPQEGVRCLYEEKVDLTSMGTLAIHRASHVEPDDQGQWWPDLSPMKGPMLGPFRYRSAALDAERRWLEDLLTGNERPTPS